MGQLALAFLWGIIAFIISMVILGYLVPKLLYLAAIIGLLVGLVKFFYPEHRQPLQ